jgi:alpha-tubulin suppressor-like RCC1 family protein
MVAGTSTSSVPKAGAAPVLAAPAPAVAAFTANEIFGWGADGQGLRRPSPTAGGTVILSSPISIGISNAKDISGYAALLTDGTVRTWGPNLSGNRGDGTFSAPGDLIDFDSVVLHTPNINNVVAISGRFESTAALRSDGTVWMWGSNQYGALGNGTTTNSATPTQVPNLSGVGSIAMGRDVMFALKTNGTLWAWGKGSDGLVGNGGTTDQKIPVQIATGIAEISVGEAAVAIARRVDGQIMGWGDNHLTTLSLSLPAPLTKVPTLIPGMNNTTLNVASVSIGNWNVELLLSDGSVSSIGWGQIGQLGTGSIVTNAQQVTPVGITGVKAIYACSYSTFALKFDGSYWAWGERDLFGDGTPPGSTPDRSYVPVQVSNGNFTKFRCVGGANVYGLVEATSQPTSSLLGLSQMGRFLKLGAMPAEAADPVNTATGGFDHSVTDLSLPGKGEQLSFSHNYDSRQPDSSTWVRVGGIRIFSLLR